MSTVRQVITTTLRWLNVTGRNVPKAYQAADALEDLQTLYLELISEGADLQDVLITGNYTAGENQRILDTLAPTAVVSFPATINTPLTNPRFNYLTDAAVNNTLRAPTDFSTIVLAGSTPQTVVYDANLGAWVSIEGLALDDAAPWSVYLGQSLVAMLAAVIADSYALQLSPFRMALAVNARNRVLARLQMSGPDQGSMFMQPDRVRL